MVAKASDGRRLSVSDWIGIAVGTGIVVGALAGAMEHLLIHLRFSWRGVEGFFYAVALYAMVGSVAGLVLAVLWVVAARARAAATAHGQRPFANGWHSSTTDNGHGKRQRLPPMAAARTITCDHLANEAVSPSAMAAISHPQSLIRSSRPIRSPAGHPCASAYLPICRLIGTREAVHMFVGRPGTAGHRCVL